MKTSSIHRVRSAKPNRASFLSSPKALLKNKPARVAPLAAAIASVCFPSLLLGATATWTGTSGATWDTSATNWSNVTGTPWDSTSGLTDAAVFNTASAAASVSGTVWANSLTLGQTATISNGTITLAGAAPTITANANATIASVLAGSAGLIKTGGYTLTLTGSNSYTGTTAVNAGALTLSGTAGAILSSSSVNVSGATLALDNSGSNLNNRIGDSATVNLNANSTLAFTGNGTTASTTESIGTLALGGGAATVTLGGAGTGQLQTLAATSISRAVGATALIRGTNLQTAATNATRLTIGGAAGTGLTMVGAGTGAVGVSTAGTNTTLSIVPYLIGDTNSGGTGSGFVTYDTDATNYGLRLLAAGEYNTLSAAYTTPATAENVNAFNGAISTGSSVSVNSLRFNTASQTLDGSGGNLVVNSGAVLGTANNVVIGGSFSGVTLGNGSWNEGIVTQTTGTLTINAPISVTGSGGLTKAGAGTLVLSASDAIAGGVTVNGGALQVNNANALGTGTLTINNGAGSNLHFNLPTSGTVANSIVANTQVNLYLDASNNLTLAGNIVPNSNISFYPNTAATSGTITFTGSNSFAGNYFCSGTNLTLRFGSTNSPGSAAWWPDGSAKIILLNGVTFNGTLVPQGYAGQTFTVGMDASGTATFSGRIYNAAAGVPTKIDVATGAQLTLSGPFTGSGTYIKTGAGTAIVSNGADAIEAFVVSGGVLQVPNTSAIGTGTYGTTLDGGTFQYTGASGSTSRPLTITANGGAFDASGSGPIAYSSTAAVLYTGSGNRTLTLTGTNTGANTLAASIADSGTGTVALVKSGTGTWVLSGSNSYSGGTQINAGTLSVVGANSLPGGSLTVSGSGALAVGNAVSDASVSAILAGSTFASGAGFGYDTTAGSRTAGSNIGGGLSLVKIGGNTLTLTGSNSYTGSTTASSGTLALGPSAVLSSPTSGVTLTGAALDLGTTSQTVGAVAITAAAASGDTVLNGTLSGTSFAVSNTSGTAVLSANLAGVGAVTKSGAGALWLSGSSTFSGGITVNAGTLQVNAPNALGTGTLTIANGAPSMYFNTSGTVANPMSINEGYTFTNSGSNNLVLSGNINGNGNAVNIQNASASGTITLTGSNNFSINGFNPGQGTVRIGSNYAAGANTTWRTSAAVHVILLDGVTCGNAMAQTGGWYGMDTSGTASFTGGFWPPSSYTVSTVAGSQLSILGTLFQSGTLNKIGTGTAILNDNNSGQTLFISGGVLQVSTIVTSSTNGVTLDGGTLGFTGASASTARPLTITANGGAFDASGSGPVTYSSTAAVLYTGSGNRTLTLTGANTGANTLAASIANSGTGAVALAKSGVGTWVLSNSNSYSGGTVVSNGVLLIGNTNSLGSGAVNVSGGILEFPSPWWSKMASAVVSSGGLGAVVGGTSGFASADLDTLFTSGSGVSLAPGETILLDTSNGSAGTATYGSVISANVGLVKTGSNALVLSSSNAYAGPTRLTQGALNSAVLANGGQPSSIGASTSAASNLIIENGAILNASGTTDRLFTLGSSGQAWISASGGPLAFTNTGDIAVSGSAGHNLRLAGSYTNTFAPAVHDYNSSNKTQFTVQNTMWLVTGTASDYTGVTNIDATATLVATSLVNGGQPSSIGASTNAASNLVFGYDAAGGNNTLRYAGAAAASTDRLFTLGSLLGGGAVTTIDNSGGDALSFTNTGAISVATTASTLLGFAGSNNIVFAPAIVNGSGTVGVTKSGSNIAILSGSNSYTGSTSVTTGTLQVGNGGTTGSIASTSSVSISSGATLGFSRTDNYGGSFTKVISGAGGLSLNSGTLTLTGSNTFNGPTTVAAGAALQLGDGVTGANASAVTLNAGSTLGVNFPNGGIFNAGLNIGPGTVNMTSSGTNTITGQVNGYYNCTLNQNGTGTTILSNAINPFYGNANVIAGALQLNGQYSAVDATINIGSAGLLTFGTNAVNVIGLTGSGGVVLQNGTNGMTLSVGGNNQSTAFGGVLSGSNGALTVTGTNNVLTLTGLNTYTGLTAVSSGSLQIGDGGTTGSIASSGSISIASGATLAFNRSDDYGSVLSQPVTGSGRLLISSGSLTLSSTSSFSGDLVLVGGTLVTGGAAPLPSANLDGEGGTLNIGPMVSATFGGLKGSGNLNVVSTSGSAITLTVGANGQSTVFNGSLSGSNVSLNKAGTGTLALGGSNVFTGGITINDGHLTINNAAALGTGTLTFNKDADTNIHLSLAGSGTIANPISILKPGSARSYNFYQDANTSNAVLAGNIVGNGNSVNFYAGTGVTSGTITLTGSNSFGADVWFHKDLAVVLGSSYAGGGGTLRFGYDAGGTAPIRIALASGVSMPVGIAADGGGTTQPIYLGMQSSGTASLTGGFFMLTSTSVLHSYYLDTPANAFLSLSGYVYGGALSSLTKTGAGTANLSAPSGYTSPVTVSGGVLQVSSLANGGSISSLGASTNAASNLTLDGGTLRYAGGTVSTDRQFTLGANGGSFDASGTGPVTFSSTAAAVYSGSGNRTLTLTGTNTGINTLAASISDNGADIVSLAKTGAGTWVLSGSNSYSGGTTVNNGTLSIASLSSLPAGSLTVSGSAALTVGNAVDDTTVTAILVGASFAAGASFGFDTTAGDRTTSSNITGPLGLVKIGANTLTLTGSNTFSGGFTVTAGALQVNHPNALGTGTLTINNGATSTMHFATSGTVANPISINEAFTITNDGSNSLTLAGNITGNNGTVSVNNATASGTITLTGSNKFNGDFWNGVGTYRIGSNYAYGGVTWRPDPAARIVLLNGITFSGPVAPSGSATGKTFYLGMDTSGTAVFSNWVYPLGAGGTTDIDTVAGAQLTFNGLYGGTGLLLKTGSGTAILTNNYGGGGTPQVIISGGVLQVASLANGGVVCALGQQTASGTNLIIDGGTLRYAGGTVSTDRQFTLGANGGGIEANGSGPVTFSSTAAVVYAGSGNRTLMLAGTNAGSNTLAASIADNGADVVSLSKSGAGTWVLTGSNSYSGGTTVNSGTLRVGNANALGTGGLIVNSGVLDLHGNSMSVPEFGGAGGRVTNLASGTSTLTANVSGSSTYAGALVDGSGAVALTMSGTGTLVLSGSIKASGLNASAGMVSIAQSGSIGAISIGATAKLELSANNINSAKVLDTSSLSISAGGTLDLWDNALILRDQTGGVNQGANLSTIQGLVNTAFNNGAWDNPGITSSSVIADLGAYSVLTVMVYDNTVLGVDSFEGINGLQTDNGGNQVMLKTTYLGDFDGNGIVNSADYGWLDFYYGYGLTVGDLNGDGQVNSADYNGIDYGYGYQAYGVLSGGGQTAPVASAASAAAPASPEAVPEPGTLATLLAGAAGLLGFRRKALAASRLRQIAPINRRF